MAKSSGTLGAIALGGVLLAAAILVPPVPVVGATQRSTSARASTQRGTSKNQSRTLKVGNSLAPAPVGMDRSSGSLAASVAKHFKYSSLPMYETMTYPLKDIMHESIVNAYWSSGSEAVGEKMCFGCGLTLNGYNGATTHDTVGTSTMGDTCVMLRAGFNYTFVPTPKAGQTAACQSAAGHVIHVRQAMDAAGGNPVTVESLPVTLMTYDTNATNPGDMSDELASYVDFETRYSEFWKIVDEMHRYCDLRDNVLEGWRGWTRGLGGNANAGNLLALTTGAIGTGLGVYNVIKTNQTLELEASRDAMLAENRKYQATISNNVTDENEVCKYGGEIAMDGGEEVKKDGKIQCCPLGYESGNSVPSYDSEGGQQCATESQKGCYLKGGGTDFNKSVSFEVELDSSGNDGEKTIDVTKIWWDANKKSFNKTNGMIASKSGSVGEIRYVPSYSNVQASQKHCGLVGDVSVTDWQVSDKDNYCITALDSSGKYVWGRGTGNCGGSAAVATTLSGSIQGSFYAANTVDCASERVKGICSNGKFQPSDNITIKSSKDLKSYGDTQQLTSGVSNPLYYYNGDIDAICGGASGSGQGAKKFFNATGEVGGVEYKDSAKKEVASVSFIKNVQVAGDVSLQKYQGKQVAVQNIKNNKMVFKSSSLTVNGSSLSGQLSCTSGCEISTGADAERQNTYDADVEREDNTITKEEETGWQTGLVPTARQLEKNRIQSTVMDWAQLVLAGGTIAGGIINVVNNSKNVDHAKGWADDARKCRERAMKLQVWYRSYSQDAGD